MKNILLLFFGILSVTGLLAQQPEVAKGNGKITGIVIDSLDNVPVQFATIALNNPETGKPIDGTIADEKGKFTLSKVPNGSFDVVISFVGYQTKTFPVTIAEKKDDINLGTIKFSFEAAFLKDVVVEGQRAIIEERVDRTVYNAENDKTTAGGDASEVLRRVPMLSVDLDGNVSMRGNSNVMVLINNKPSTIMASSIADALKQIPADMIKSVEVITSPSAKYDAEGSAGIINIITKKNTLQGLTLNIDAGAGLRGSNLGLNGNYRKGKMGFSLGGFGRAGYNVLGSFDNTQQRDTYNESGSLLYSTTNIQTANTLRRDLFGRYQFGWDYEINKNNSLAASVRYGTRNGWNFQDDLRTKTYFNDTQTGETLRQVDSKDLSGNVDVNLDYTRTFAKPQREFSFLTMYSRNNRTNNFETTTDSLNGSPIRGRKNDNLSFNQEVTFQADYQTPIGDKQLVEIGGKNISRTVSSEYQYFNSVGDGAYTPDQSGSLSNTFNYNQNVTGGYLSYTYNSKSKYSFKAGGRYEYTTISANFAESAETEDVSEIPSYGVFVPSLNVSRKLKAGNTLKLAYNKRIQRPSIQFLNPNIQSANALQVTKGNPNLDPEYTDNFELSYNTFIKGTTLNFSGFYRNTTGAIQSVRTAKGDTLYTTYVNLGQEQAVGLNFFGNVSIGKKFTLNGGVDSYYAMLNNNKEGQDNIQNEGWVFNGRLFGNYTLKNGWGLQMHSHFRGRNVSLQGYQGGFRMYGLSIRKEFNDKKGSIGLGAENFVTPSMTVKSKINSTTYSLVSTDYTVLTQNSTNIMYNLNLRVTFSYRIGKMSFDQQPRRKRSVNNDDLKDGGDGGNGGGMDQQQQGGGQRNGGTQVNGTRPGAGGTQINGARTGTSGTPAKTTETPAKKSKKKKKESEN
jgi:outer membrane receptor protein involved in Fe transport